MAFALSACDDAPTDGVGGAGTTSSGSATKASSASGTANGTTSGATTGTTSGTTAAATTGGGPGEISASLVKAQFYMDCMPVVGPDPIAGSFEVAYENTGGAPAALDVSSATLSLMGPNGGSLTWAFEVAPKSSASIAPGGMANVIHAKVDGSGMGTPNVVNPCSMCGGKWALNVGWNDGVTGTAATLDLGTVGCVQ